MSFWSTKPKNMSLGRGVVRKPSATVDDGQDTSLLERSSDNFDGNDEDDDIFGGRVKFEQPQRVNATVLVDDDSSFAADKPDNEVLSSDEDRARAIVDAVSTPEKKRFGRKAEKGPAPEKGANKGKRDKKVKVVEEGQAVERLSSRVLMDFLPGMAKDDAIEMARHMALNHLTNPSNGYFVVLPFEGGYAFEVQEGVGRSYLSSVLDLAMNNPGRLVVVPMLRRKMTIVYASRSNDFTAQILNEGVEPPEVAGSPPLYAVRGAAMKTIMKQHMQWLISGMIMAGIGGVALIGSIAFFALDPKTKVPPEWRVTDVAQLPVMQWQRLQSSTGDSYVARLEYTDNAWRVVRQAAAAEVDVLLVNDSGTSGVTAGPSIRAPGSPAAPGTPQSTGAVQPQGVNAPSPSVAPVGSPSPASPVPSLRQ